MLELLTRQPREGPLVGLPERLAWVTVVATGPVGAGRAAWLQSHLSRLPAPLRPRLFALTWASGADGAAPPHAWAADLDAVDRALGGDVERRTVIGSVGQALTTLDASGETLPVLLADAGPVGWALRRARGPVLVLPPLEPGAAPRPRARVLARAADEVEPLCRWSRLLPAGTEVDLRAAGRPSDARAGAALDLALAAAGEALTAAGLAARVGVGPLDEDDPAAVEDGATIVVRAARRGLLRRLLPGPDARLVRRARQAILLVPV
ncbi:MAG: hypothetical protein M9894_25390 [Planctomycetes bacterium]|nr:hypothetical protein [Planctomycetota bacterium]